MNAIFIVDMDHSKRRIVVFTGAGVSAESGLRTFRDSDGLWEGHRVEDVATPEAWRRSPQRVLDFYNERRRACVKAEPNAAHKAITTLETRYDVWTITQNVDDLHERAGTRQVLHLHGELRKARSTCDERLVYDIEGTDLHLGQRCEKGSQLRPHIVWFGEAVPQMEAAIRLVERAEIMIVVGSSLVVYPAASLIEYRPPDCRLFVVDPKRPDIISWGGGGNYEHIELPAATGVPCLVERLLGEAASEAD